MKFLYILSAFFMGCDYLTTEHTHEHTHDDGICGWQTQFAGIVIPEASYTCYANYSQFDCSSSHMFWIPDMTCEEYCASKECGLEEAVDSAETVEGTVSCECRIIE